MERDRKPRGLRGGVATIITISVDLPEPALVMDPSSTTRIVVVGGGAGGLELATHLGQRYARDSSVSVTLVDRGYTHLWKPLLHEVAAGILNSSNDELSYLAQAHWHHFEFRLGALLAIDRRAKTVTIAASHASDGHEYIPERVLPYTYLVLAIGSVTVDSRKPDTSQTVCSGPDIGLCAAGPSFSGYIHFDAASLTGTMVAMSIFLSEYPGYSLQLSEGIGNSPLSAVPVPGPVWLLSTALAGLGLLRRPHAKKEGGLRPLPGIH